MNKLSFNLKNGLPIALSIISSIGVIVTAVKAVHDTPKALKLLEDASYDKSKNFENGNLTVVEKAKVVAPVYASSIILGVATIACIVGAQAFNAKQQANLVGAFMLGQKTYNNYRNKLVELYGKEVDDHVMREVVKTKPVYISAEAACQTITDDYQSNEKILFYDEWSDRVFESTMLNVVMAEYHLNRNYAIYGYACIKDFYDFLGLPDFEDSEALEWTFDYMMTYWDAYFIDFMHQKIILDDGRECYKIVCMFPPQNIETV